MPLDENEGLEQVVVLRSHLEEILAALQNGHSYFTALDLAEGYRNLRADPKRSKLTSVFARAYNRVEGYLVDERISESDPVGTE